MREKWSVEITNTYLAEGTGQTGEPVSAGQVEIYMAPNEYATAEEAARAAALRSAVYEHRIINARPVKQEDNA